MTEIIGKALSIFLLLFQWFYADKIEKAKRAKEIAEKLKQISKDGDILFDQVYEELNQRSDQDWDEIPVRDDESTNQ